MPAFFKNKRSPWFLRDKAPAKNGVETPRRDVSTEPGSETSTVPEPSVKTGSLQTAAQQEKPTEDEVGPDPDFVGTKHPAERGSDSGSDLSGSEEPGLFARLGNRFNLWAERLDNIKLRPKKGLEAVVFKFFLFLTILAAPFYFLPPVFTNFFFWREMAIIGLALGLLGGYALNLAAGGLSDKGELKEVKGETLSFLRGHFNLALFFFVIVWLLAITFSPARLASFTSTTTWAYLGLAIIAFMLGNHLPLYAAKGWRLVLGAAALLILALWLLLYTPWLPRINALLNTNLQSPRIMNLNDSWVISLETVQNRPLLGLGPGLYPSAFASYRPARFNLTNNWGLTFTHPYWPGSEFVVSFGILGVVAVVLIGWTLVVALRKEVGPGPDFVGTKHPAERGSDSGSDLSSLQPPASKYGQLALPGLAGRALAVVLGIIVTMGTVASYRAVRAQQTFAGALQKITANQPANLIYQELQRSINLNPYQSDFRRSYAAVNFALANIVAGSSTDSPNPNQDAQTTIQQLVQQAIREVRITTEALNPTDARNWQTRGQIYRQLIGVAAEAEGWAIKGYQQAIALNSLDPRLRIELGGVYFQLAQTVGQTPGGEEAQANFLDLAVEQFRAATRLKPDLANAHYNLAYAYKEQGRNGLARLEFQRTLNLVEAGSVDAERAQAELANLGAVAGAATGQTPGAETPQQGVSTEEKGPFELTGPSPTPTLEPTATPTVTPTPTKEQTPGVKDSQTPGVEEGRNPFGPEGGNETAPTPTPTVTVTPSPTPTETETP